MRLRRILRFLTKRKRMSRCRTVMAALCSVVVVFFFLLQNQSGTSFDLELQQPISFRDMFLVTPNRTHTMISAFVDTRPEGYGHSLKILGYGNFDDLNPVYCKVFYTNGNTMCLQYPAIVESIGHSKHDRQTVFNIYSCRITKQELSLGTPKAVSFVQGQECEYAPHALQIVQQMETRPADKKDKNKKGTSNFCVCFPQAVFKSDKTDVQDWVEFLEMSQILGADYVQVFNTSSTWPLFSKLSPYIKSRYLQLVNWTNEGTYPAGILTERTVLSNDCLYRNLDKVKYMVIIDSNELLIPHKQKNWREMLESLKFLHNSSLVGAYMFRTVPYYDESFGNTSQYSIYVPRGQDRHKRNNYRLPRIVTHRLRAKSALSANEHAQLMLDPRKVTSISVNGITVMLPGFLYYTVPMDYANVHRFSPRGKLSIKDLVVDSSMDKYVTQLLNAMHQKFYSTS